jgi:hypothetical protein
MSPKSYYRIDLCAAAWTSALHLERVEPTSRKDLRRHVERFAHYFLREMHFNGLQFEAKESPQSVGFTPYKAFLFATQGRYIGAACFRLRADQDPDVPWEFDWLWLHPYFRRQSHMTTAWSQLVDAFDPRVKPSLPRIAGHQPFRLARPISQSMERFLQKIGWEE